MKLSDILTEMPAMVPYPKSVADIAQSMLTNVRKDNLIHIQDQGMFSVLKDNNDSALFLFKDDQPIGLMHFSRPNVKAGSVTGIQVLNVFIVPEYRNKQLGMLMYRVALHSLKHMIISAAAMTPDSRRVYTSFLKDPSVDVYAIVNGERVELSVGPNGITTGDATVDNRAAFVLTEK